MNNTKYILIILFFILSGCATISTSSIPEIPTRDTQIFIEKENRKDITFSVTYLQEVVTSGNSILTDEHDMAEEIRDTLKETKLFRKIHYVEPSKASDYHLHFNIMITGTHPQTQTATALIMGYTLFIFPIWFNYNVDISMSLIVKDKEVYSVTAPQKVKDVFWLPFVIAWPILNHGIVGNHIENKAMDYFVSEIIENKLYDYPIK